MNRFNYILSTVAALLLGFGVYAQDITHPSSGTANFTVDPGQTVMYYDDGGSGCDGDGGSYSNSIDATAVICPSQAGETITIEFLEVDIETRSTSPCWDYLRVYDGTGATFGGLLFEGCGEDGFSDCPGFPGDGSDGGGVEGGPNDINGSNFATPANNIFTSTATDGCLTVNLDTDGSVDQGGWIATAFSTDSGGGGDDDDDDDPVTGCPDGQETFLVEINLDDFGQETSWELTQNGSEVASNSYSSSDEGTPQIEEYCVTPGCYEFTIFDSFGDGICCSFGNGNYTISDGTTGQIFGTGGDFGSSETTEFCIGSCNEPPVVAFSETSFCSSGNFYIFVDLQSTGQSSSVDITSSNGEGRQYFGVSSSRTYITGPFEVGSDVTITVSGVDSPGCEVVSQTFNGDCGSALVQGNLPTTAEMGVFPNPTLGELNVNVSDFHGQQVDIVIYDAVGRVVTNRQIDQVETFVETFDLSGEQAGMYMVAVKSAASNELFTKRFIVGGRP